MFQAVTGAMGRFRSGDDRPLLFLFVLLCLTVSAVSFGHSVGKNFSLDETDIAARAHMILAEGPKGPEHFFGATSGEAMPHPPFCEYVIALVFRLFGETEIAARSFGIFCYVLVGILMLLTLDRLLSGAEPGPRRTACCLALGMYLVNPLLIQHAMLVDADSTLTYLFVNLFVYCFIRFESDLSGRFWLSRLGLAVILALTFLSKEGTPFLVVAGMAAYRLLNRQWKKLAIEMIAVWLAGLALAWGVWLAFCHLTGIDQMIFLKQLYGWRVSKLGRQGLWGRIFKNFFRIGRWPVFWMSFPFFVMLVMSAAGRVRQFFRTRKLEPVDICFTIGGAIWVLYYLLKPSIDMMKYQQAVYPFWIAAIACGFTAFSRPVPGTASGHRAWFIGGISAALVLATLYYYRLGDYLLMMFDKQGSVRWMKFCLWYYAPLALAYGAAVSYAWFRKKRPGAAVLCVSLLFLFPINTALDLRQTAPYTTVESWLNYGETGLPESVDYLAGRLRSGTTAALRKDFIYYLKLRRGLEFTILANPGYFFWPESLKETLRNEAAGRRIDYLIFDPVSISNNPPPDFWGLKVMASYGLDRRIGNFAILRPAGQLKRTE